MPSACPQGTHITRRRGVYHWRRRLPGQPKGEIMVSLRTRRYREAEHLAAVADDGFSQEWKRLVAPERRASVCELKSIIRGHLRDLLDKDTDHHATKPPKTPLDTFNEGFRENGERRDLTPQDLLSVWHGDMAIIQDARDGYAESAGERAFAHPRPEPQEPLEPEQPAKASSVIDHHFSQREARKTNLHSVNQERDTLRLFLEICGDRPFQEYNRADIVDFLATLRRLPAIRGRSPADKAMSVVDIIARANASGAERISEGTIKRHLSALTQFFATARDGSQITRGHMEEILQDHGFKRGKTAAREQREQWTSDELVKLFASPWWSGRRSKAKHTEPGGLIERDHRFWLPLLALFHGARLEELADLYSRDIKRDVASGIWAIHIQPSEGNPESGRRTLKNVSAKRVIPIHPEIIRMGFLGYVRQIAPRDDDPLFPELEPQGVSRRRGARFTRDFIYYRQKVGLYQKGKGMHSFRHTVETRLMDEAQTEQHRRHIRFILGHSAPPDEGSQRYDKGPGLQAKAETLALLRYPELDLSHLYVRE